MEVDELDGAALHDLLKQEPLGVLVDFWSPWCAPCRALRPHLHRMAEQRAGSWRFVALNTEEHPDAATDFGVRALPTLVLFRGGKELYRFSGSALPSSIDAKLDELA